MATTAPRVPITIRVPPAVLSFLTAAPFFSFILSSKVSAWLKILPHFLIFASASFDRAAILGGVARAVKKAGAVDVADLEWREVRAGNVACQPAAACRMSAQSSIIRVMATEVQRGMSACASRNVIGVRSVGLQPCCTHFYRAFEPRSSYLAAASHALTVLSATLP